MPVVLGSNGRRLARRLPQRRWFVVLLYAGMAVASTWPLILEPADRFPVGTTECSTVPLFNIWSIWWNADRAAHGFDGYWNAPIFHPASNTFAYSEPQPLTLLVAPVIWLTGSRVLACNVYLLLSLMLNGIAGNALLRSLRVRQFSSLAAGAAIVLLPVVHWQRDVVQLIPLWPSLWTLRALIRLSDRPRVRSGAEAGLAFGVTFLTCGHHGLFLAILLAGTGWILLSALRERRTWTAWLCAACIAAVVVLPVARKLQEVAAVRGFERSDRSVARLSAQLGDYTAAWGWQPLDPGPLAARELWPLSPGFVKYGLAFAGLIVGLRRRRLRRATFFLAAFGALACALSLGVNLSLWGWQPWEAIADYVPGASQVRNVYRFVYFMQLAVVLLAGAGLSGLAVFFRYLATAWSSATWKRSCIVVPAALAMAAIVEVLPPSPVLAYAPNSARQRGWVEFIRKNTSARRAIACIPFATGNSVSEFQATTWWMYQGTWHGVPMVNGYSGFFPDEYFSLRRTVNEQFPAEIALRELKAAGVEYVLVGTHLIGSSEQLAEIAGSPLLELAYQDDSAVDVYRIRSTAFAD